MHKRETASALLVDVDKFHLQSRENTRSLGAPSLMGFFGVEIKQAGIDKREALSLILESELGLELDHTMFEPLEPVYVSAAENGPRLSEKVSVFKILLLHGQKLSDRSDLVTWGRDDIQQNQGRLSPAARKVLAKEI